MTYTLHNPRGSFFDMGNPVRTKLRILHTLVYRQSRPQDTDFDIFDDKRDNYQYILFRQIDLYKWKLTKEFSVQNLTDSRFR